jgi:hypothetical protein
VTIEPGTLDVVELVVALVVKISFGLVLLAWDEKRLAERHPDWLERAFPPATRLSAIVVFQEIGVYQHFRRTREGVIVRRLVALFYTALYIFATSLVLEGVDVLLRPEG